MRKAFKDRPFAYHQRDDGLWGVVDERLGIGAIARTREEAYDKLCTLVLDHLKSLSDEELEAHMAGCEVVYIDDEGRLVDQPPPAASTG